MKAIFRRPRLPQANPGRESEAMRSSRNAAPVVETNPTSDHPINGNWDSTHTTVGAGVAIFHLASSRVVLCYHSVDKYWFLPKGRRDAGEETGAGAEREGYEEV